MSFASRVAKEHGARPFPEAARALIQITSAESFHVADVVRVIESDPALTSQTLSQANSAVYARHTRCTSVYQAVTLLGTHSLRSIATTAGVFSMFDDLGAAPAAAVVEHGRLVGVIARRLAPFVGLSPDEMYTCGLLHDVGKLMLLNGNDLDYPELLASEHRFDAVHLREREEYGFDHAVLAGHVLKAWRIPAPVPRVVGWHHQPERAFKAGGTFARRVALLRLSDRASYLLNEGAGGANALAEGLADDASLRYLGLSRYALENVRDWLKQEGIGAASPPASPRAPAPASVRTPELASAPAPAPALALAPEPLAPAPAPEPLAAEPGLPEPEAPAAERDLLESEAPAAEPGLPEPEAPAAERNLLESEAPAAERGLLESEAPAAERGLLESEAPAAERGLLESEAPAAERGLLESEAPAASPSQSQIATPPSSKALPPPLPPSQIMKAAPDVLGDEPSAEPALPEVEADLESWFLSEPTAEDGIGEPGGDPTLDDAGRDGALAGLETGAPSGVEKVGPPAIDPTACVQCGKPGKADACPRCTAALCDAHALKGKAACCARCEAGYAAHRKLYPFEPLAVCLSASLFLLIGLGIGLYSRFQHGPRWERVLSVALPIVLAELALLFALRGARRVQRAQFLAAPPLPPPAARPSQPAGTLAPRAPGQRISAPRPRPLAGGPAWSTRPKALGWCAMNAPCARQRPACSPPALHGPPRRAGAAFACSVALALGCSSPAPAPRPAGPASAGGALALPAPTPGIAPAAWLAGHWVSDDGAAQETWVASAGVLLGVGFRARSGKTAFWEAMSVDADEGLLRLRAMPKGGDAVSFEAEEVGPQRVWFENAAHDAPKRVAYERKGARLGAELFDGGARPSASFSWGARPLARAPELEQADRRLDADVAARGAEAWVEAFDERGALLRRGRRSAGREAIRKALAPDFRDGLGLRREPAASAWSPARDLGFTAGRWKGTRPGDEGEPAREARGTYLSVWALDAGGRARLLFDADYDDAAPPPPPERALFRWPLPDGWRGETIALPPEFARDMTLRGLEEVRFAPRFFDPDAETYFSYSFAWVVGGEGRLDAPAVAEQLRRYFAGLMAAVGAKGRRDGAAASAARLHDDGPGRFAGTLGTVDAFGDGRPLKLQIEVEASECAGRRVLLFTLSPREPADPVWARLREQRKLFRCKPPA